MNRRPPPDTDARFAYIEKYGLSCGARVLDVELNKHAVVIGRTVTGMVRIRYEELPAPGRPERERFKLVNPVVRLVSAP